MTNRIVKFLTIGFAIILSSCSYNESNEETDKEIEKVSYDKTVNVKHAAHFESLVVQDNVGRLKPVGAICSEYLRKIYGKDKFNDLSATQVILAMMTDAAWRNQSIVKVTHPELRKLLGSNDLSSEYIRVSCSFFDKDGYYLLKGLVDDALGKGLAKQSEYERDILLVDKRVFLFRQLWMPGVFRLFPLPNDSNNTWFSSAEHAVFTENDSLFVGNIMPMYFTAVGSGLQDDNWAAADSVVNYIRRFQNKYAADQIIPLRIPLLFSVSENDFKIINPQHEANFESLVVQDIDGRSKPAHTFCSEYLRKIYGKDKFNDLSATQVILSMLNDPYIWSNESIVKVTNPKLRKLLGSNDLSSKFVRVSFNSLFDKNGHYLLKELVEDAFAVKQAERSKYENDIIQVNERYNLCFNIFRGGILRSFGENELPILEKYVNDVYKIMPAKRTKYEKEIIKFDERLHISLPHHYVGIFTFFPLANESNNTWYSSVDYAKFSKDDSLFVANIMPRYFKAVTKALKDNNWATANSLVAEISKFQKLNGPDVMLPDWKIKLEIMYNKIGIFYKLFMYYFIVGLIFLSLLIIKLFKNTKLIRILITVFKWLIVFGFFMHTAGLIIRWIISGHAPWSDAYESIIYSAWATVLAGLIFSKRFLLTLSAAAIVASLILMVAHLSWIDPQISNLVPVLKSYWLMIHVSMIVASYGFFALAAILGFIALWLIVFTTKSNKSKLVNTLSELTIINEKTLQVGLFMLAIGTFLGGVWANESWGRYWGWDPKETWALISILVYVFVLHMRFIPPLKGKLVFNFMSLACISTIIMTYFGVNYFLSGLHAYGNPNGTKIEIPMWIYYSIGIVILTGILARFKYKKYY